MKFYVKAVTKKEGLILCTPELFKEIVAKDIHQAVKWYIDEFMWDYFGIFWIQYYDNTTELHPNTGVPKKVINLELEKTL